jgi:PAS domain S-box-containing protein
LQHKVGLGLYFFIGVACAVFCEALQAARRRAEASGEELRRSEQELADFFENATVGLHWVGPDGTVLRANRAELDLLGYAREEYVGRHIAEFHADQAVIGDILDRLQKGEKLNDYPARMCCKDGTVKDVLIDSSVLWRDGRFVHTRCFTRDVTEQKRAQAAAWARTRQLELVTDNAPVFIAHCDADRRFKFVNKPYAARFGLHPRDIIGRAIADVLGDAAYAVLAPHIDAALAGRRVEFEVEVPYRDLGARFMRCAYEPELDPAGRVVGYVGAILDVTDSKRVERALQEEGRTTETLHRIGTALAAERDLERIVQRVTDETTAITGAGYGAFFYNVLDGRGESYTLYTLSGAPREAFARFPMPRNTAIFEPTFRGTGVVRLDDVTKDARYGKNAPHHGMPEGHLPVRSYLAVPVVSRSGEVLGGLFFGHAQVGVFTARHERLVEAVAAQAAVAIDNARLYGQLRESEGRLRLLTDALPVLISYVDSDQRYRVVNRQYEVWFGRPRSQIQGRTLREVLGDEAHAAIRERVEAALAGREVNYETPIRYRDAGARHIRVNYVPHVEGDRVRGFFALVSDVTASKRAEQDARFLADASAALAGLVDYESTLQAVARLAVPHFADWCAVDMLGEGGALRRVAVAHVDPSKVELAREMRRRYPPDPAAPQGVWNVIRTGKPELAGEITDEMLEAGVKDAGLLGLLRQLGLRSYMGVPLIVRGKVLGAVTFIAAESGRRYGADDLALAEDLAQRAAVAIDNARLYQEVREADRRKDEFLAVLGHELRNPLAPISNALHILKQPGADGPLAEQAREVMERQVQHMARLVDDLLDVSRIVRGKVELRKGPVELAAVVARAAETAQPLIEAEGHELAVAMPDEPLVVSGDLVRLAQVVGNLLNNAARYTERGGKLTVEGRSEGDQAVLRVRDTGTGIAPEVLPRIWDMFVQADRRLKGAQGGMGIGLSLVKGLVELHGGAVEARSDGPGKGSEFVVALPLLAAPPPDEAPGEAAGRPARAAPRRVLVVDDHVDAAESLAMLLRVQGHEVRVAHDGPAALRLAEADPPEIAFLDIGMPGMTGHELARRFREREGLRGVTLVAMTGWGQAEDRRRTSEAGFDHHLVKPADLDALQALLAGDGVSPPRGR